MAWNPESLPLMNFFKYISSQMVLVVRWYVVSAKLSEAFSVIIWEHNLCLFFRSDEKFFETTSLPNRSSGKIKRSFDINTKKVCTNSQDFSVQIHMKLKNWKFFAIFYLPKTLILTNRVFSDNITKKKLC